jgi:hypothetical protein
MVAAINIPGFLKARGFIFKLLNKSFRHLRPKHGVSPGAPRQNPDQDDMGPLLLYLFLISIKKMSFDATFSDTILQKYLTVSRLMRIWVYFIAVKIELDSAGLQVRRHLQ